MNVLGMLTLLLSVAAFGAGVAFFFTRHDSQLTHRLLALTVAIIAAILFVRLTFTACGLMALSPTLLTEIMQTFSLDADYSILDELYSAFGGSVGAVLIVVYTTLLYTAAPIAGGAVIYDVLAGVSPVIRLWFVRHRTMFVFSQINEASVTLAEDVVRHYAGRKRVVALFADTDISLGDDSELLTRIRKIGAICLDEPIDTSRVCRRSEKCSFFLMDRDGEDFDGAKNLAKLDALLDAGSPRPWNSEAGANILFFSDESEIVECVRAVKANYDAASKGGAVSVNVVRPRAQTCCMQLKRVPLYGPLGPFEPGKPLRVALFGDKPLALEMFRTIYWCGQMMDTPLYVTMVVPGDGSGEAAAAFEAWLDHLNPEILQTCTAFREDGGVPADCLRIWPNRTDRDAWSPPYCSLDVVELNPARADIRAFMEAQRRCAHGSDAPYRLLDADYFMVMWDGDEANLTLAGDVRRQLLRDMATPGQGLTRAGRGAPCVCTEISGEGMQRVVARRFESESDQVRMVLFGSYRECYSWENVFLDESFLSERDASSADDPSLHGFVDINRASDNIYDSWSNIGRNFHLPYKNYYIDSLNGVASARDVHRLMWLEHRRWCALIRAQGFRQPFDGTQALLDALPQNLAEWASLPRYYAFKDFSARLHPCLVECADHDTGLPAWLETALSNGDRPVGEELERHDLLDVISMVRTCIQHRAMDLKAYDLDETERMLIRRQGAAVGDGPAGFRVRRK